MDPLSPIERSRRLLVNLIFLIYWLVIFEGVIRKWILPQWSSPLFFIKDPVILLTYLIAYTRGLRTGRPPYFLALQAFALLFVCVGLAEWITGYAGFNWLLAGYGFRSYFLFVPLTFLIARYFDETDLARLGRQTLIVAIPIAILMLVQSNSSPGALVNASAGGGLDNPGYGNGYESRVRPFGTFTSSGAQNSFTDTALTLLLVEWFGRRLIRTRHSKLTIWIGGSAVAISLAVSGSRGAIGGAAIQIVVSLAAILLTPGFRAAIKGAVLVLAVIPAAVIGAYLVVPAEINLLVDRFTVASQDESQFYQYGFVGRALIEPFAFVYLLPATPAMGFGVGTGGNAVGIVGTNGTGLFSDVRASIHLSTREELSGAESGWGRHLLDLGPFLGMAFILLRIAFTTTLARRAVIATKRSGNPVPLVFFGGLATGLLYGNITGNGTNQAYTWLFTGFTMAASRIAMRRKRQIRPRSQKPLKNNLAFYIPADARPLRPVSTTTLD